MNQRGFEKLVRDIAKGSARHPLVGAPGTPALDFAEHVVTRARLTAHLCQKACEDNAATASVPGDEIR